MFTIMKSLSSVDFRIEKHGRRKVISGKELTLTFIGAFFFVLGGLTERR